MNEVKLVDFDKETLSLVSDSIAIEIEAIKESLRIKNEGWKFRENYQDQIDKLQTFQTQILYAFSLVKEREKVTNS